ncbi:MAG: hypothetical protein ABIH87_00795 [bacterium]
MAILGQIDEATLARRLDQTRKARARQNNQARAKSFFSTKPLKGAVEELSSRLRQEREDSTHTGLHRRNTSGRWIARDEQMAAIAAANKLEKLGY